MSGAIHPISQGNLHKRQNYCENDQVVTIGQNVASGSSSKRTLSAPGHSRRKRIDQRTLTWQSGRKWLVLKTPSDWYGCSSRQIGTPPFPSTERIEEVPKADRMAKKKKTKTTKAADEVPFEESLDQLREVVSSLESGNLSLGQSLEKYEQGIKHLRQCHMALEQAEQKIKVLVSLDPDGNLNTKSFDGSASQLDFAGQPTEGADDHDESEEPEIDEEEFYDDTEDIDDSDALF